MSVHAEPLAPIAPPQGNEVGKLVWPKKSFTVRLRQDLRAGLDLLVEIRKRKQVAHGLPTSGIDVTKVLEEALEEHLTAELAKYGLSENDLSRSDNPTQRDEDAKAAVERIAHLIDTEAKK